MPDESRPPARLDVLATPLGNLGDADPDLVPALEAAEVLVCEDSRVARRLLSALGVALRGRTLVVMRADNEAARTAAVRATWAEGRRVALLSDAGMPLVSDPGSRLVRAALEDGVEVRVVPGPSAVTAALAISGFDSTRWCFEGFLPRAGRVRAQRLAAISAEDRTVVLFEAPARVARTLADLWRDGGGQRRVVVANDLTKRFERVWRGTLADVTEELTRHTPRGEFTVVLEGADG